MSEFDNWFGARYVLN